jgi:hypothetical protein
MKTICQWMTIWQSMSMINTHAPLQNRSQEVSKEPEPSRHTSRIFCEKSDLPISAGYNHMYCYSILQYRFGHSCCFNRVSKATRLSHQPSQHTVYDDASTFETSNETLQQRPAVIIIWIQMCPTAFLQYIEVDNR